METIRINHFDWNRIKGSVLSHVLPRSVCMYIILAESVGRYGILGLVLVRVPGVPGDYMHNIHFIRSYRSAGTLRYLMS